MDFNGVPEQSAGSSIILIFALALIVVLMVLAAQYERNQSYSSIMAVPCLTWCYFRLYNIGIAN